MANSFIIPELGDGIDTVDIVSVLVKTGDTIESGQDLIEVETDKATMAIPADFSGTVESVAVQEGDTIPVGAEILTYTGTAPSTVATEATTTTQPKAEVEVEAPATSETKAQEHIVRLPDMGDGVDSAEVVEILVKVGDSITLDQELIEIETDKAATSIPSDIKGTITEILVAEGQSIASGDPILKALGVTTQSQPIVKPSINAVTSELDSAPQPALDRPAMVAPTSPPVAPKSISSDVPIPAAPSVRRLAREIGVRIEEVSGTGPSGRISKDDVKAHAKALLSGQSHGGATHYQPLPDFSKFGTTRQESMTKIRKLTAQNMAQAWSTIPMVTQFDKADITDLEKLRKSYNKTRLKDPAGKITVTAILLKALAAGLRKFPHFNASIDMVNHTIVYKDYIHLGVAVDTDRGLMVPVIRDIESKNIEQLALEVNQLAAKARDKKITPADLQGACSTITNLGGIGGHAFTPIVNPPEVCILGVSRAEKEPVFQDGQFTPRLRMPLMLTYDHRIIDGADAARFLRFICDLVEQPALMVFEG